MASTALAMTQAKPASAKVFAMANQKGGVAKTASTVNLATAIAAAGHKVLIVDVDSQGNAGTSLGIPERERSKTIYDLLSQSITVDQAIISTKIPNLDIITSNMNLAAFDLECQDIPDKERLLASVMVEFKDQYDYVFIDCPPSLGLVTVNALMAADSVIIPVQAEFLALEGLVHLIRTIELIQNRLEHPLAIEGILLTMMDKRNKLAELIEQEVRTKFGDLVYKNHIPRTVSIAESSSNGVPVLLYDYSCKGSQAYMLVAREILDQQNC